MCGISGYQVDERIATSMRDVGRSLIKNLHHRGPDATGEFRNDAETVVLGHNRLSIIDLSELGNQPMVSDHGDVLVLNGEIYNFKALRQELVSKGHSFISQSDTEVLLKSYLEWGIHCVDKIKGMYAFAIWSERDQVLHLARDPLGMKPLYVWQLPNNEGIVFASELKAFLGIESFNARINKNSLSQFVEFGYTFNLSDTIFSDVAKLPPGHRLEVRNGQPSTPIQFYTPELCTSHTETKIDLEQHLYETMLQVVEEHLIADVPIGLLLSGGLDSSLLAAFASKHVQMKTFSMGFTDSYLDERPFARIVSDFVGSQHQELLIEPQEVMQDINDVAAHYDDLFADWGMVSTRLLYKMCADQGVKVVLVGEGSDELFGGYGVFQHSLSTNTASSEWSLFQLYRHYAGRRYGKQYFQFRHAMKQYMSDCNGDLFSAIRLFESRNQLPNNFVMKVDKASMSLSIEARAPFLDSRIADIAYRIPRDMLINNNDEKLILKSMAKRYGLLPDEILNRKKYGTGMANSWMDDSATFRAFAQETILAENSWVDELGLRDSMQRYFLGGQAGYSFPRAISVFRNTAWRLLLLCLWGQALGVKA